MKRFRYFVAAVLLMTSAPLLAGSELIVFSPGVKYTVTFGEPKSNVFGIDISLIFEETTNYKLWGINSTIDLWAKQPKLTVGYEYFSLEGDVPFGISYGPAVSRVDGKFYYGMFGNGYLMLPMMFNYQYTGFMHQKDIQEFGIFVKAPLGACSNGHWLSINTSNWKIF